MNSEEQTPHPVKRPAPLLAIAAVSIAAIVFGEADDAPGLVMLGLLFVLISGVLAVKPGLRNPNVLAGILLGAVALAAIGATVAGWLENNF